jgi:hypothetical protein
LISQTFVTLIASFISANNEYNDIIYIQYNIIMFFVIDSQAEGATMGPSHMTAWEPASQRGGVDGAML